MEEKKVIEIKLEDILPNRFQPRLKFSEDAILELSESIKEHGIIQPIVVRQIADKYEIIAGERRYKASVMAEKNSIPAIVTDLNDKDSAEVALIENVQRQNLTPIEEAISYKKILDMGYLTQDKLAEKLGKTQSTVANKLRLLNLDEEVQEALLNGKISERHARSLLKLKNTQQVEILNKVINERLTVRATDKIVENIIHPLNKENNQNNISMLDKANMNLNNSDLYSSNNDFINKNTLFEESNGFNNLETNTTTEKNIILPLEQEKIDRTNYENGEYITSPFKQSIEENTENVENDSLFIPSNPIIEQSENQIYNNPNNAEISQESSSTPSILNNIEDEQEFKPANISILPTDNIDEESVNNINYSDELNPSTYDDVSINYDEPPIINIKNSSNELDLQNQEPATKFFNFDLIDDSEKQEKEIVQEEKPSFNLNESPFSFRPLENSVLEQKSINIEPLEFSPVSLDEIKQNESTDLNNIYANMNQNNGEKPKIIKNNEYSTIGQGVTDLKTVINTIRSCVKTVQKFGFQVDVDELDLENVYEFNFKIYKN